MRNPDLKIDDNEYMNPQDFINLLEQGGYNVVDASDFVDDIPPIAKQGLHPYQMLYSDCESTEELVAFVQSHAKPTSVNEFNTAATPSGITNDIHLSNNFSPPELNPNPTVTS